MTLRSKQDRWRTTAIVAVALLFGSSFAITSELAAEVVDPNGNLEVIETDALAGGFSVRITVDDSDRVYLRDERPQDLEVYRARFLWRHDALTVPENKRLKLLTGFSDDPVKRRLLTLTLRQGEDYLGPQLRLKVRRDDGEWIGTSWTRLISPEPVGSVTLEWRQASTPDSEDGEVRLWVDGVLSGELTGIDNSAWSLDRVHWGVVSAPKAGTTGSLRFDSFESWDH